MPLNYLIAAIVCIVAFSLASDAAPTTERYEATVVSVISASALQISADSKEYLVSLYGAEAPPTTSVVGLRLKNELRTILGDGKIQIQRIRSQNEIEFSIVYLSSGECLNELIVALGMATWDSLLAPEYHELREAEESAKSDQVGLWKPIDTGSSSNPNPEDIRRRLREYNNLLQVKRQAFFDSAFKRWGSLHPSIRADILLTLIDARSAAALATRAKAENLSSTASKLEQAAQSKNNEVQNHLQQIDSLRERGNATLAENYDDFSLQFNSSMARSLAAYRDSRRNYGLSENPYINASVDQYQKLANDDSMRVEAQAKRIHENYTNEIGAVANEAQRAAIERRNLADSAALVRNKQIATTRFGDSLQLEADTTWNLLMAIERSIESDYRPETTEDDIELLESTDVTKTIYVTIHARLWRIECDAINDLSNSGLVIDVFRKDADKPFSRLSDASPYYKRFLILDEAGSFRIKIGNPNGSEYRLSVCEFRLD